MIYLFKKFSELNEKRKTIDIPNRFNDLNPSEYWDGWEEFLSDESVLSVNIKRANEFGVGLNDYLKSLFVLSKWQSSNYDDEPFTYFTELLKMVSGRFMPKKPLYRGVIIYEEDYNPKKHKIGEYLQPKKKLESWTETRSVAENFKSKVNWFLLLEYEPDKSEVISKPNILLPKSRFFNEWEWILKPKGPAKIIEVQIGGFKDSENPQGFTEMILFGIPNNEHHKIPNSEKILLKTETQKTVLEIIKSWGELESYQYKNFDVYLPEWKKLSVPIFWFVWNYGFLTGEQKSGKPIYVSDNIINIEVNKKLYRIETINNSLNNIIYSIEDINGRREPEILRIMAEKFIKSLKSKTKFKPKIILK